jgi:hypothetical protein
MGLDALILLTLLTSSDMDTTAEIQRLLNQGMTFVKELEPSTTGFRRFQFIAGRSHEILAHLDNPTRLIDVVQSIEEIE